MSEPFTPPLHLHETAGQLRLSLGGWAHGHGQTLQEAADDLVGRLLHVVMCVRESGLTFTSTAPHDLAWLEFLWELGDLAQRGDDIRPRVFG